MALQIFGFNSIGTGLRADLTTADSVFVAVGITVGSNDNSSISGTGSYHTANIQGTVVGGSNGILLGDDGSADSNQHLIVGENGYIGAFANWGATLRGFDSLVENDGTIFSSFVALLIDGTNAASQSTVINTGLIDGGLYGIFHSGSETLNVENNGTIKSGHFAYVSTNASAIDQITNTGKMDGTLFLGGGNDVFDSRLGTLSGTVNADAGSDKLYGSALADTFYGGDDGDTISGYAGNDKLYGDNGNDALVGGAGADALSGGAGTDRAYYSGATTGVVVSLLTPSLNTGEAKGDTFSSIENLTGSKYNDSLFGNAGANSISGGAGNDIIKGYAGKDALAGGSGNDTFVFDTALSAATNVDTISDYNVAADTIRLENAIFTKLTATGVLDATAFVKNTTGVAADASDRIVYETDTGKLLYDRDGNGASYAGVQFAKLAAGLAITSTDFFII
ncbi:Ca2+-binding RTX toxin-like protein [Pararhizobium capsulatum DSM 1112]|uniref:Ca2+-binding RTX toxin-like protein n=1 Tax=Pararhizobium capsulatum DSM 1112 TaxID=1121113 RepID=A0ABU0BXZ9_9HYPH|nr:calcium-binding protein [Pararhizobium capsulatum]MDQ0323141.1 Ca2+-binding RTX toxin-like protein [Pararhizobium capsulatum DSM 1112]